MVNKTQSNKPNKSNKPSTANKSKQNKSNNSKSNANANKSKEKKSNKSNANKSNSSNKPVIRAKCGFGIVSQSKGGSELRKNILNSTNNNYKLYNKK